MEENKITVSEEVIDYITSKQKGVSSTLDTSDNAHTLGIDESGDDKKHMVDDAFYIDGPDGKSIDPGFIVDAPDGRIIDPGFYIDTMSK